MATERRKMKKKSVLKDELEKPTKEEYSVARCLRFQGPSKEGKFNGNFCPYFVGSKVVDFLLSESQWGTKCANKTSQLYTSRSSCVTYCARLLEKGFFHRVEKIDRRERLMATAATSSTQSSKKSSAGDKLQSKDGTPGLTKRNKGKKDRDATEQQPQQLPDEQTEKKNDDDVTKAAAAAACKTAASDATTATSTAAKEDGVNEEKKKRRKPAKLRMHDNQTFIDSPDAVC
ncbi:hypothetical protein HELRODRAFT_164690 [Helobdella robusta]|uniref:Translocation protein SEC62 n=1 Tax=Helobdella robusta TaxID=6412 RepID=T1EVQ3_HELRO|nr:hypothetical protein HELRODRAFT_164690 [Helobdella robusta]ESN92616.1 hypothetical protein HELRODRAFT_164690 [Helobdella robusta]